MSHWQAKRFWKEASVQKTDHGYQVFLDARKLKTPAKAPLVLPTKDLAQAIVAEWLEQEENINPNVMPLTRYANTAIDRVAPQFSMVVGEVAHYGSSDLLCYRAKEPDELVHRQAVAWNPLIEWSERVLGAPLRVTSGVMAIEQHAQSLAQFRSLVSALDPFSLAGLHDLTSVTGSLVLGLAVFRGHLNGQEAFEISHIDEAWQVEKWGDDEEQTTTQRRRLMDLLEAERFVRLCHR